MMAMANHEPASQWRNFAAWSAVGALFYIPIMLGVTSLLSGNGMAAAVRSTESVAIMGLALLVAMAVVGFSSRERPLSLRNFRNFVIRDGAAIVVFLLVLWGFSALSRDGALDAMGASEWFATVTGLVLVVLALLGILAVGSTHTGTDVLDDEMAADDMRERGRLFLYSFVWMAGCGLLLILLGLAGPGGMLSPPTALAAALVLVAVLILLGIAVWRLSDELARTLSNEAGSIAFYLVLLIGGGWSMLAHLGYAPAPAPLDWLTMFTLLMFVASFIAAGRRKLLTR